jgi:regulator of protease activity HflC (stomatin/prohibitin superfamily)
MDGHILFNMMVWGSIFAYTFYKVVVSVQVVPNRMVKIVERFGKFHSKLEAGFHLLIPWADRITYTHDLREQTVDVPPQQCFTRDSVRVMVDGVMYIQVADPIKASYGVADYRRAAMQLALTTSRAVIATLELDRTFEERDLISARVVDEVSRAGRSWGIQVLRYEIKAIEPPETVKAAMEMQVTAERQRRAVIHKSEGDMQSRISRSEGMRNELVSRSSGERQRIINEAQGRAREIEALAEATAASIEKIAQTISAEGGDRAVMLRLSEAYIDKLRGLARNNTQIVLPGDLTNLDSILSGISLDPVASSAPSAQQIVAAAPQLHVGQQPYASSQTQPIQPMPPQQGGAPNPWNR